MKIFQISRALLAAVLMLAPITALAQPSNSGPWALNGATIYPKDNSMGVTIPSTVTGGNQGPGTINAAGIYINGVSVQGFGNEARNTVLAGPLSGSPAMPTFRSLTNADLASPTITINSTPCTLGSSCTVTPISIVAGTTSITGTTHTNGLLANVGNVLTNLTTANNGVLVTSDSGVPSISSTLPSVTVGGTLTLAPTGNAAGFNSSQTISGSSIGFPLNSGFIADTSNPGSGGFINGWQFQYNYGTSTLQGGRGTIAAYTNFNIASNAANANRNYVGIISAIRAQSGDGGTNVSTDHKGAFFAHGGAAIACGTDTSDPSNCPSGAATNLTGLMYGEADVEARLGSSVYYKSVWSLVATGYDAVQGTGIDGALSISSAVPNSGVSWVGWKNAIVFSDVNGHHPIATNGNIIGTVGAATIGSVIDVSSYTISNYIVNSANFKVTGAGTVTAGVWNGTAIANANLANASTTVNGQTCTLGSTCTISVGSGTVTSVSVTTANGVSGTVANATTTPAITLTLGAITPSSVNGNTITTGTGTLTLGASKVLTASNTLTFTGTDGSSVAFGTGGTVLYSGGPLGTPSSGTLTNATGLPVAGIASIATNTVVGNATAGSASPTALPVGTCSTSASALIWTTNTGFGCNTAVNAAQLGGATFAAPGAIGGGTPGSGAFTTLTTSNTATVMSASAQALAVGLNGATNPAFTVDASTALQVAGLKVTGAVTGGTVALVATDSGSNTNVTWNAKGSGTFSINATATGGITLGRATTITTGGLSVSAGDVTVNSSSGALNINGTNVRLSNAGPGGVVAGQTMFGTNVSTGATATVLSFGGNIGGADGPLSTISGAVGGSTTHIGGELRLQGGISTAATGAGGAVTIYAAAAAAGTTPVLVATFANDKSLSLTGALSVTGALTYGGVTFTTVSGTGKLVGSINPAFTGSISSTGVYTENLNATALPAVITGTTMQIGQADSVVNATLQDAFGSSNQIIGRRTQGTNASPTQLLNTNSMLNIATRGYDGSGAYSSASNATISLVANEDWIDATHHGTAINFTVTPNATNSPALVMTVGGTGVILPVVSTDAGHTDVSLCLDTTSKLILSGTGTLGICLGTSSARYKNSIKPLEDGLEKIVALQPKTFFYNKDKGDGGARIQVGFLAEDVVNVMSNLVDIDADARPNTVDILGIVPAMVNAIKELKASNDNLAAQVEILKRAVNK